MSEVDDLLDEFGVMGRVKPFTRRKGKKCEAITMYSRLRCQITATRIKDGHRVCGYHASHPVAGFCDDK